MSTKNGGFRKPIGVGTALLFERSTKVGQQDRSFCQRFNGIEPILGEGVCAFLPREFNVNEDDLVQGHHLARRGLANQPLAAAHWDRVVQPFEQCRASPPLRRKTTSTPKVGWHGSNLRKALMAMASNPFMSQTPRPYKRPDCSRTTNGSLVQPWASTGTQSRWPETIKPSRGIHFRTSPSNQICLLPRGIVNPLPPNPGDDSNQDSTKSTAAKFEPELVVSIPTRASSISRTGGRPMSCRQLE